MSRNTQIIVILFAAVVLYGIIMKLFFKKKHADKEDSVRYDLIAKNFTMFYRGLCDSSYGASLSEDERLFAVGYIGAYAFLEKNLITTKSIKHVVSRTAIHSFGSKSTSQYFKLISLILQLELLMFAADNPNVNLLDANRYIEANEITVEKTVEHYMNISLDDETFLSEYISRLQLVGMFCDSVSFRNIVESACAEKEPHFFFEDEH